MKQVEKSRWILKNPCGLYLMRILGAGIMSPCPIDQTLKLSDLFYAHSLNRKYQGAGLGLALVKRFADLMKGEVGLSSEINQGSRFWFRVTCPIAEMRQTFPETMPLDRAESIESWPLEAVCLEMLNGMELSADFESLLDDLDQALAKNLFSSIAKAKKLQETLEGNEIGKRFSELFMLIHELRFEEAYNQLQKIRRELTKKI